MALEKENETYERRLPEWKGQEGKFVLIRGDKVVNFFTSYEDAIGQGYREFGLKPFLVKQISAMSQVQFITRMVDPCASESLA